MSAAHLAGEISAAHLAVVVRKLDASPARAGTISAAEGTFLAAAREVDPRELGRVVNRWVDTVDPLGAIERECEQQHQRNLTASATLDGAVHLSGLLPPGGRGVGQDRVGRVVLRAAPSRHPGREDGA
jgi:hypothetical protein